MRKDTTTGAGLPVKSCLLAASLMLGPGLAQANTDTAGFDQLDQNGDSAISKDEYQAAQNPPADYDTLDIDRDGQISRTEFAAVEGSAGASGEPGYDQQTGTQENRWEQDAAGQTAQSGSQTTQSGDTAGTSDMTQSGQSGTASQQTGQQTAQQGDGQGSQALQELAKQEDRLSDFVKAVEESGLADALTRGDTQYTIFAPTNDAFDASGRNLQQLMSEGNQEELVNVLRAHIVADDVDPEMAKRIGKAKTLAGGSVQLTSEGETLKVGDAKVVASNIQQGSLRVYAIDGLIEAGQPGIAGAQESTSGQTAGTTSGQTSGSGQTAGTATGGASGAGQTGGATSGQTGGAVAGAQFDELDEDGNGYLDEQELQNAQQDLADQQQQLDSDGDGQVSRTEFAAFEQESGMMGESASDTPSASDMPPHNESSQEWNPDE